MGEASLRVHNRVNGPKINSQFNVIVRKLGTEINRCHVIRSLAEQETCSHNLVTVNTTSLSSLPGSLRQTRCKRQACFVSPPSIHSKVALRRVFGLSA